MNKTFTVYHDEENNEVIIYKRLPKKVILEEDDEFMTVPYQKIWIDDKGRSILLDISGWKEPGFGNKVHKYIGNSISIFEPIEGDVIRKYTDEKAIGDKYIYLLDEKVYVLKEDIKKNKRNKLKMKVIVNHLGRTFYS